jgi:methionyl-tRNA formyltransferase
MRQLVFLGTPAPAAVVLEALIAAGHPIHHVITRPDARRGRGGSTSHSPVKDVALSHGLTVVHDLSLIEQMEKGNALGIVVAYGRIIPERILNMVPMINVHFSLLPRWRGAAPVERAILAGDAETGVCIMDVEPTLDTGAVYGTARMTITETITADQLTDELAKLGSSLLVQLLNAELPAPTPQAGEVTYAHKLSVDEFVIDWSKPSHTISREVRALPMYTYLGNKRLKILQIDLTPEVAGDAATGSVSSDCLVATGDQMIRLVRVQPEGKPAMSAHDWRRGLQGADPILGTVMP